MASVRLWTRSHSTAQSPHCRALALAGGLLRARAIGQMDAARDLGALAPCAAAGQGRGVSLWALPWPWGSLVASPMTQAGARAPLSTFAGDGQLSVAEAPWQDLAVHRDLGKLEKWHNENLTRPHKAKCQVLHLAWGDPRVLDSSRPEETFISLSLGLPPWLLPAPPEAALAGPWGFWCPCPLPAELV